MPERDDPWQRARGRGATPTPEAPDARLSLAGRAPQTRHVVARSTDASAPSREQRLYGLNAVRAVFARRPEDLRKLWLAQSRVHDLRALLKWCAAHRVGYRIVEDDELQRLAVSSHHEGVVADVRLPQSQDFADFLRQLNPGPQCLLWLDGVGNPHNLGAILRSAAHFGVAAVLVPEAAALAVSGAAARVAEGGAESVPLLRMRDEADAMRLLHDAGFALWATLVEGGPDLFAHPAPQRLVYVMGAEQAGMDRRFAQQCDARVSIPGTGAVESLNVAAATAVLLAHWARQAR